MSKSTWTGLVLAFKVGHNDCRKCNILHSGIVGKHSMGFVVTLIGWVGYTDAAKYARDLAMRISPFVAGHKPQAV